MTSPLPQTAAELEELLERAAERGAARALAAHTRPRLSVVPQPAPIVTQQQQQSARTQLARLGLLSKKPPPRPGK